MKVFLFLLITFYLPITAAENTALPNKSFEFATNEAKAKTFFLESTIASLKRLQNTEKPVQVDLYIAVHFLMYNDTLHFTDNAQLAQQLTADITTYFYQQLGKEPLLEGCLGIKLLIALAQSGKHPEFEKQLAKQYFGHINKQWQNKGVGECFVTSIDRTYGQDNESFNCTPSTQEMEAKTLFYLTQSKLYSAANIPFTLPTINTILYDEIDQWWKANVELWVIKDYHADNVSIITKERYIHARRLIEKSIDTKQENSILMPIIAYGYLLTHAQSNTATINIIKQLSALQREDGAIPSPFTFANKPTHNLDASPTYFYLLALNELKKKSRFPVTP